MSELKQMEKHFADDYDVVIVKGKPIARLTIAGVKRREGIALYYGISVAICLEGLLCIFLTNIDGDWREHYFALSCGVVAIWIILSAIVFFRQFSRKKAVVWLALGAVSSMIPFLVVGLFTAT